LYVAKPPDLNDLLSRLSNEGRLTQAIQAPIYPAYDHWDKIRHLDPPEGLTHEEWWWSIRWRRSSALRELPLTDADGNHFFYALPDEVLRALHHVDQRCSGEIAMPRVVTDDEQARQHYLVNSLMEEAIRSSQLEGATTSRRVAKELLTTGREPQSRSERMILNNYRALQFTRGQDVLTPLVVLELQRILTEGTLDDPDSAGRLQRPDEERIAVFDVQDGSLIHKPPPADQLPERLEKLCEFANGADDPNQFMHPVVRAVLLHFWLAYDHPFEDGNGRTARALFYWSMRTQGYWLVEYLSISSILRKAPAKYAQAFLLTETDNLDATYFLLYNLEVMLRAVDNMSTYLRRKTRELANVERALKGSSGDFNHRQLALLSEAIRDNLDRSYTFRSHAASHNVTHETSRRDLLALVSRGLLNRRRVGRRMVFTPPPDLADLLTQQAA
jgi:Fic family protein